MEENIFGGIKDVVAITCSYSLAWNFFAFESQIITGCFVLGGVALGRILDWSWESWKKRRARRKRNRRILR